MRLTSKSIQKNQRISIDKINCCHGSAYNTTHDKLGYHEVCTIWVPKQQIEVLKNIHSEGSRNHFDWHHEEIPS
jgi:hypothetical protein